MTEIPTSSTVAAKLADCHWRRLAYLERRTGWGRSEIIRQLIMSAVILPPIVRATVDKNPEVADGTG